MWTIKQYVGVVVGGLVALVIGLVGMGVVELVTYGVPVSTCGEMVKWVIGF